MMNLICVGDDIDYGGKVEIGLNMMCFDGCYVVCKGDCVLCFQYFDVLFNFIEEGDLLMIDDGILIVQYGYCVICGCYLILSFV